MEPVPSIVGQGPDAGLTRPQAKCQACVSTRADARSMPEDSVETTIRQAIGGDSVAIASVIASAASSGDARTVALAALLASRRDWIARAERLAVTTRDRQVVAISASYLTGQRDLVQVLARDHLADHPGSLIVSWIASMASGQG